MNHRRLTMVASVVFAAFAGICSIPPAGAQVPGFKRVELQRHDLATPDREVVVARGEFQAGAVVPKHTHPGDEVGYVLEGELTVEMEGKPALKLKAGDTFLVPAGTVHTGKNAGKVAVAVISTYIIEKGKPISTPAK